MTINKKWHKRHLKLIEVKAGARYTPKLNINLPISEIFNGISRTDTFYTTIREKYGKLQREFRCISSNFKKTELQKRYNTTKKIADTLFLLIKSIKTYNVDEIPWEKINIKCKDFNDALWKFSDELRKEKDLLKTAETLSQKEKNNQQSSSDKIDTDIRYIYKTQEVIRYFEKLSSSKKGKLSNHPYLLLTGSAGTGKTHLLCDITENRIKNNLPVFLSFGEYFSNEKDFWKQLLDQLEISKEVKTKKDFLNEINILGKKSKSRSLIIIDALNENIARAPFFWKNNLSGIIKEIKKYPHIALVISIRNGFTKEVLTDKQKSFFIREEHNGFQFREWEAVNIFFNNFSLPLPEIPLLMPEFQNPLFLLLFCKAFQKRKNNKKKQIFRGHEGLHIFLNLLF